MPAGTTTVERGQIAFRLYDVSPGDKTPNCVECSRCVEHAVCSILHLVDSRWVTEQTSRYDQTHSPLG